MSQQRIPKQIGAGEKNREKEENTKQRKKNGEKNPKPRENEIKCSQTQARMQKKVLYMEIQKKGGGGEREGGEQGRN